MLTESDKGWMAGILDFQGHVVRKNNKQRSSDTAQITVTVTTSIQPIIDRLSALTGTAPQLQNAREPHYLKDEWLRKGCVEHCPEEHVHQFRTIQAIPMYCWTVTGVSVAVVLWNLHYAMSSVHEPWDWALAQCLAQARLTGRGSGAVLPALQRLQDLGWMLPPVFAAVLPSFSKETGDERGKETGDERGKE
jgi:hypothetical protein